MSVSTFIFFLTRLYKDQLRATTRPTHGKLFKLKNIKIKIEIKTKIIEKILFLFKSSLKKIYPNKTQPKNK